MRCDIFQVDVGLLKPFFQVFERDHHVNEVVKIVGFQFFADTRTCKHDFHVLPVQLFQNLGVSQHGRNNRGNKTHVFRGIFPDVFNDNRTSRGDVHATLGFFQEFFSPIRDNFSS